MLAAENDERIRAVCVTEQTKLGVAVLLAIRRQLGVEAG